MRVRFTPSARLALLEAVAALRRSDRARAEAAVDRARDHLARLGREPRSSPEIGPLGEAVADTETLRLYYRQRADAVWVLAVWWGSDPLPPELEIGAADP